MPGPGRRRHVVGVNALTALARAVELGVAAGKSLTYSQITAIASAEPRLRRCSIRYGVSMACACSFLTRSRHPVGWRHRTVFDGCEVREIAATSRCPVLASGRGQHESVGISCTRFNSAPAEPGTGSGQFTAPGLNEPSTGPVSRRGVHGVVRACRCRHFLHSHVGAPT